MTQHFASGTWHVTTGKEEEFIERWTEFLQWTRDAHPSLVEANLMRDHQNPSRFLSFAEWQDPGGRDRWKESDGFKERLGACRALCEDFRGGDYDRVMVVHRP